jgi:hypothetical protein
MLRVLSDWGVWRQAVPRAFNGVRRARRLNLSRDLRGIAALRFWTLSEIASPIAIGSQCACSAHAQNIREHPDRPARRARRA